MGTQDWKVGWKQGAGAWGTAIAVGAACKVLMESESMGDGIPTPINDAYVGGALRGRTYQGDVACQGDIVIGMRYNGFERFLAQFMGSDVVTVTQASKAWLHTMAFQPNNAGKYGTLVFDKGIGGSPRRIAEFPSAKVGQIGLNHNEGRLMATVGLIANKCERDPALQQNNAASIDAVTLPGINWLGIKNQVAVKIKEVTGAEGNLAGGDEILVTNVQMTGNRNQSGITESGSNAGQIGEPETDGGLPEASIVLSLGNYGGALDDLLISEATQRQTASIPKLFKAEIVWTGPQIETTSPSLSYFLNLQLPALTVRSAPQNAGGPGSRVPVDVTLDMQTPQAAGNGSDWVWSTADGIPFRALMQNALAAAGVA